MKISTEEKLIYVVIFGVFLLLISAKIIFYKKEPRAFFAPSAFPAIAGATQAPSPTIYTYLAFRSTASLDSLKKNITSIDGVIVDALHLKNGSIAVDANENKSVYEFIRSKNDGTKIYAMVNNYSAGAWQGEQTEKMLSNIDSRTEVQTKIMDYVVINKLNGVSLDFEAVNTTAQDDLVKFTAELAKKLHEKNMTLSIHIPADSRAWKLSELGLLADQVIVMAYDQNSMVTMAGPIAAYDWYRETVSSVAKRVPATKIVAGLGNYAYDWTEGQQTAESLSDAQAFARAAKYGAEIKYDEVIGNDTYKYTDASGKQHIVWMLDARSAEKEVHISKVFSISNFAVYRLGSEDQAVWKALK